MVRIRKFTEIESWWQVVRSWSDWRVGTDYVNFLCVEQLLDDSTLYWVTYFKRANIKLHKTNLNKVLYVFNYVNTNTQKYTLMEIHQFTWHKLELMVKFSGKIWK